MEFARLHLGLVLVIVGVAGEGIEIIWKLLVRERSKKLDLFLDSIGAFFWIVLVVGLALEIPDAARTDNEAAESNKLAGQASERASSNEVQVAILSTKLIELAHQYDLSTNALAEANARLTSIRPLKDRLIECLNLIDPSIMPALKEGKTKFELKGVSELDFSQLVSLLREPNAEIYCSSLVNVSSANFMIQAGKGQIEDIDIVLKPALVQ